MNETIVTVLLWLVNLLLTALATLIGVVVHQHIKADDERLKRIEARIAALMGDDT